MYTGVHTSTGYSRQILMKLKCQISWKYVQWEPNCSMRTDGQTDLTKLIVAFRNFVNAPTDQVRCLSSYSSMETYSAKCPGILPSMNKLSYELIDHDIYIRRCVYEMMERRSRPVPQGNLLDQREAEIQMRILFCQRTILRSNFVMALNNNNTSSEIQRRVLWQTKLPEKHSNKILLMQK